jgi:hypothetical protein
MVDISIPFYTHMLYGWNIYQHLPEQNHPVTMEHMGHKINSMETMDCFFSEKSKPKAIDFPTIWGWLVVSNMNFIFHSIWDVILPID